MPRILLEGRDRKALLLELLPTIGPRARGFVTAPVLEKLSTVGYQVRALDGREGVHAHVRGESPHRWDRFKVFVGAIDSVAVPSISGPYRKGEILVIGEIGEMMHYSKAFQHAIQEAFDSGVDLVAALGAKPEDYIAKIKMLRNVSVIEVSTENRHRVKPRVLREFGFPA